MKTQNIASHPHTHKPAGKEIIMRRKISNFILFIGSAILVSSLIYMLFHLNGSDQIVRWWFPIVVSGVLLIFLSQFIYPVFKNSYKNWLKFRS